MGLSLPRRKRRELVLSGGYALARAFSWLPLRLRFAVSLDFAWFFERMAHEFSFKYYPPKEHPIRRLCARFLLDWIEPRHRILDLGCGGGDLAHLMAGRAARVVGVDHSSAFICEARARFHAPNLEFYEGDAFEYLGSSRDAFDVMVLCHVLEHIDDPGSFLRQCARAVPALYLEVPDFEDSMRSVFRADLGRSLIYTDIDHVSEFGRDDLRPLLEHAGWSIVAEDHRFGFLRFRCRRSIDA